ncbi:MAG: hypothetical protein WA824_07030 [Candidatus Sulfotelmatobacter sp.]
MNCSDLFDPVPDQNPAVVIFVFAICLFVKPFFVILRFPGAKVSPSVLR